MICYKKSLVFFSLFCLLIIFNFSASKADSNVDSCKERLPEIINRYQPAIIPVINLNGDILYFDRKMNTRNLGGAKDRDDIWFSRKTKNEGWSEPENFGKSLNTSFSDVLFSITPDGAKALVYGVYDKTVKKPGFSIADFRGGKVNGIKPLNILNFKNDSDNFYANLSSDGRTLLLAISNKNSYGNLDLYASFYDEKSDSFSEPMNLGKTINSRGCESSPFLAYDNKTLYFASDGRRGYGSMDLYISRRLDDSWKKWSEPQNLGPGVNTKYDESSIYLTPLGDSAFVVSSDTSVIREGIYKVCMPLNSRPFPYAIVRGFFNYIRKTESEKESESKYPQIDKKIDNVKNMPVKEKSIFNKIPQKENVEFIVNYEISYDIDTFYSNPETDTYAFVVTAENQANVIVRSDDFEDYSFSVSTKKITEPKYITYDFTLFPREPDLKLLATVYFDTDVDILSDSAKAILAQVQNKVMHPNESQLLIAGHADKRGKESHNLELSKRRAENAAKYIEETGFKISNIKIEGKGSSNPISDKDDPNRRVEVYFITIPGN